MGFMDTFNSARNQAMGRAKTKSDLFGDIRISPEGQQRMVDDFLRVFSSLQAAQRNRQRDSGAAAGLPPEVLAAMERGADMQGNIAASGGIADILNAISGQNAQASQFLLQNMFNQDMQQQALKAQQSNMFGDLLGGLGFAAGGPIGSAIGGKIFGG